MSRLKHPIQETLVKLVRFPQCYDFFIKLENSVFKFVIENESDLKEIDELITKYNIAKKQNSPNAPSINKG